MARSQSARKADILDAAVKVFAAHGLKATIRMVGQAAGVNSAVMYYYFENKQVLFTESIRMVLAGFLAHLAGTRREFHDGQDRIRYLVDGVMDYGATHPDGIKLISVAMILHADLYGQVMSEIFKREMPLPLEVLMEGMRKGEIRETNSILAWLNIMGACIFNLHTRQVMRFVHAPLPLPSADVGQRKAALTGFLADGLVVVKKRKRS